jgi:hypothetical protein
MNSVVAHAVLCSCSSDSTVPRLTEIHSVSKRPSYERKARRPQRWCAVCKKCGKREDAMCWGEAFNT